MICVIIPCYKVKRQILDVIENIPSIVDKIIAIDDKCPDQSGKYILENCSDPRLEVIFHETNQGVGGALLTGYTKAIKLEDGIIIKLDGDGQMDPKFIPSLISPILAGKADYTKGNRFYFIRALKVMPKLRLIGNTALSFINKLVTGYWNIMDPTNGYTAISSKCLKHLPLQRIASNYFFESDMLFRLSTISAVVKDVPMLPKYDDEESSLSVINTLLTFPRRYTKCFFKRIMYNYYLRDFNMGSLFLSIGLPLFIFGICFGLTHWYISVSNQTEAPTGTIMIAAISLIMGFQSILFFLQYDISVIPKETFSENMDLENE